MHQDHLKSEKTINYSHHRFSLLLNTRLQCDANILRNFRPTIWWL